MLIDDMTVDADDMVVYDIDADADVVVYDAHVTVHCIRPSGQALVVKVML